MIIRSASEDDLPQIVEIANNSFILPWSPKSFRAELSQKNSSLKVAEFKGEIIGYIIYRIIADEGEILSIAVKPNWRKKGVATKILSNALAEIKKTAKNCFLEVRVSNTEAIRLYEKAGFKIRGIRKNYYQIPEEDALIMQYDFQSNDEFQKI